MTILTIPDGNINNM